MAHRRLGLGIQTKLIQVKQVEEKYAETLRPSHTRFPMTNAFPGTKMGNER
jgi:hypothetical protein